MKVSKLVFSYFVLFVLSPMWAFLFVSFGLRPKVFLFLFSISLFIVYLLNNINIKKIKVPKYLWFYILFTLYTVLSDFFIVERFKYLKNGYMFGFIFIVILIENISFTKKQINTLTFCLKSILIFAFTTIILQQVFDYTFFVNMSSESTVQDLERMESERRLPSVYSWIDLLDVGLSFIPMIAIIIENALKKRKNYIIWLLIGIIYAFLSRGRWIMLNFMMVASLPLFFFKRRIREMAVSLSVFVITILASVVILESFEVPISDIVEERIFEKSRGGLAEGSASTRLLAFYVFGRLFPENPVWGKGHLYSFDNKSNKDNQLARYLGDKTSQIHVGYLSLLYYYGIVGGSFFILFLYFMCRYLYRNAKRTKHWAPFLAIFGFVIANLTLVTFYLFYAGIIVVLIYEKYYREQNEISNKNPEKLLTTVHA